ncbi:MAG: hypothetical protein ACXWKO_00365 [Phenylobacterium sp.]
MGWRIMGRIFDPAEHDWAGTHAQVPTALVYEDKVRVFYADRFADGRSYTTYLDLDRTDLSRVTYFHKAPILGFGAPGTFDDDGAMPSFPVREDGRVLLYYSGWNRGVTVPYRNSVGIAVSDDDGDSFRRLYEGPVLERNPLEPYIAVTPTLLKEGDLWRMWYISGVRWVEVEAKFEPVYVIKYASSRDGVSWDRPNHLCIPPTHDREAFSHPTVIRDGDRYRMWYCFRDSVDYRDGAGAYRIGYAESADGLDWRRMDDAFGLDVGQAPWASTMTCYPFVTQIDDRIVMFFNGNGFGRSGFGYAVLEEAA